MDLFSNLNDFMNESIGDIPVPDRPRHDLEKTLDDDEIMECDTFFQTNIIGKRKRKANEPSIVTTEKKTVEKSAFLPNKGQKTALKRLNKIKDALAQDLDSVKESVLRDKELQEKVAAVIIANADAAGKRKPPRNRNKRNNQNLNVDLIDLVSSPILNIPGVVNLDSDDEFTETATKYKKDLTEACSSSLGAENEEIKVFVKFESEIEDYLLRPYQKFSELVNKIAKQKSIKPDCILLTFREKILSHSETLRSIEYIKGLLIHAHALETSVDNSNQMEKSKPKNRNFIELQIQSAQRKRPFLVSIDKFEKLKTLFFECAEEFKCDPEKIRLEFDGDKLNINQSADDLDLEGGEMIDLFIATS